MVDVLVPEVYVTLEARNQHSIVERTSARQLRRERQRCADEKKPDEARDELASALVNSEFARELLYEAEPPCVWLDDIAGLAVRAPISTALRLERHFACIPGSGHTPGMVVLEVPHLPGRSVRAQLSQSGYRLMDEPNAGGTSEASEAWAFETLRLMLRSNLVATEMELRYLSDAFPKLCGPQGRTDFAISLRTSGEIVGVSVTRAVAFERLFDAADALKLLSRKLARVLSSTEGCVGQWTWSRQILFIWVRSHLDALILRAVFESDIGDALKADTLVACAVCPVEAVYQLRSRSPS